MDNQNLIQQFPNVGMAQQSPVVVNQIMNDSQLQVTSFNDLTNFANGTIVKLPDFAEGQQFVARLRRPSLLVLAKSGKIPNELLNTASGLFAKGTGAMDSDDKNMLGDMYDICKIIAEASLISPTYHEIITAGVELTDAQMMAIFSYAQAGVKALEPFREKQENPQPSGDEQLL